MIKASVDCKGDRPRHAAVRVCDRGQSAVEFAMVAMLALTLIFGIIQSALAIYAYNFVAYASRSAGRYATVHGANSSQPATSSSIQSYVQGLVVALDPTELAVSSSWSPDTSPGSTVTVTVTYEFKPFAPFAWSVNLPLKSTSTAVISN